MVPLLAEPDALSPKPSRVGLQRSSLATYPATFLLLTINILVFLAMLPGSPLAGAWHGHRLGDLPLASFSVEELWRFGGSDRLSVLGAHQWWRPVAAAFVHANLVHLVVNMWCLWNLGLFGEPLLGRRGLVAVYLLTGTAGNLLSVAWSVLAGGDALVVGASGAVFGIAGILIVLLSNRRLSLPWEELRSLRRQVILFAGANLALGAGPRLLLLLGGGQMHALGLSTDALPQVDNSAHLGGLLYGMLLGLPLFPRMASGQSSYRMRQRLTFSAAALLLCLFAYALARLR